MTSSTDPAFGKLRSLFWPIYHHELKKLVPMWLMMFFIGFNYSVLRCMKESMLVPAAGAEVLPFVKVWMMLPMAILMTWAFTRLSNRFSQEKVVYIIIGGFLFSFAFFAFVVYPFSDYLHPHAMADSLESCLPLGCKGLISMFRYWTFVGFYVLSELWGIVVLNVLFWGFANEVTQIGEARRFYGVLGAAANIAAIVAGQAANFIAQTKLNPHLPFGKTPWEQTVMLLVLMIITTGLITIGLFRWLNAHVLSDPCYEGFHKNASPLKVKKKLSVKDSFSYLSRSKYLICIAILVVSYNLVINMVEIVWKDQLRSMYPSPEQFNSFLNNLTSMVGVISTIIAIFMSRIMKRMGWTSTALITPIVMLVTCTGFFSFILFQGSLGPVVFALTGSTPLAMAVFFGATQNCLSKAAKYSVFDGTKEMAFIPLDHECKLKGKAAIDGVGSRLGKSGGSMIHSILLMIFASLAASAAYVGVILVGVIIAWIYATCSLGRQFNALTEEKTPLADSKAEEEEEWQESEAAATGKLKAVS